MHSDKYKNLHIHTYKQAHSNTHPHERIESIQSHYNYKAVTYVDNVYETAAIVHKLTHFLTRICTDRHYYHIYKFMIHMWMIV